MGIVYVEVNVELSFYAGGRRLRAAARIVAALEEGATEIGRVVITYPPIKFLNSLNNKPHAEAKNNSICAVAANVPWS
jgi:hypothetical protein